jgi:hypothetical protein
MYGKKLYLIVGVSIEVMKQNNIVTHYDSEHKLKYKDFVKVLRRKMLLRRRLESQQNVFRMQLFPIEIPHRKFA